MDGFAQELSAILVDVYYNILRLEEEALKKFNQIQLSINEMHLIECVGKGGENGRTISELADDLRVTSPSVTVAVGKLEKKGFVQRLQCQNDGRVVRVVLTGEGRRIDERHRDYHIKMVKQIDDDLTQVEKECLLKTICRLNIFFRDSVAGLE